jgi:hypothetical protein
MKMHKVLIAGGAIGLVLSMSACMSSKSESSESEENWQALIGKDSLIGWSQINGDAPYELLESGIIQGTAVTQSPNSFLCSNQIYSDFIVEYDFKLDQALNSGVQFRSNHYANANKGRVFGYQLEIDPSDRGWTGGVYEEGVRGWLHPVVDENPDGKKAYKHLEWNTIRLEAIGNNIRAWVNGIPTVNLQDDRTAQGRFCLQVHDIGDNKALEGATVQWKDMRILTENLAANSRTSPLPLRSNDNKLTHSEEQRGWQLLFDGETSQGWRGAKLTEFPATGWEIKDGELTIHESGGGESSSVGDIVTEEMFDDFVVSVDFKITEGANSGIKYYVDTELNKGTGSSIGLEFQILDDLRHEDAKKGNHLGSRTVSSLYDLIKADRNKQPKAIGEWNNATIYSKNDHVEHWLNGQKVLEYTRKSPEYRQLVAESKYATWPNFGELEKGHILLQDHGNTVHFKNIKIKKFIKD